MTIRPHIALLALALVFANSANTFSQSYALADDALPESELIANATTDLGYDTSADPSKIKQANYQGYAGPMQSTVDADAYFDRRNFKSPRQWFATFESVLVQPVQSNSTGLIIETDDGYSHVGFPWELNHSPRVQFGNEARDDSLGWRVRFWEFRHTQSFDANAANGLIPVGYEGTVGYLTEDGDITTGIAYIQEGNFKSSIRTDVIDWELQRRIAAPLDFYAGLRYAKIAQGYSAVTDQGNVNASSEFRGIGPTAALRFTQVLPLDKLSLFANLRGSMLFGAKSYTVVDDVNDFRQTIGGIDLRSGNDNADTLAGNAEMQMGLRYAPTDFISLSVAIEGQYYGNVGGPNPVGVFTGPDSGLSTDSPIDDGLGFLGLTVGTELRW